MIGQRCEDAHHCVPCFEKVDVDNFFNKIRHRVIRDCWYWLWNKYKEKFGRRRSMIAIPKESLPNAMAGIKSVDKHLAYIE